jgi:hypothetical protein
MKPSALRRAAFVAAVCGVCLVGFAPIASATSPNKVPTPNPDFTATGACAFPVAFHALVNKEYQTVTTMPDGSVVTKVNGSLVGTFTNTLNGHSVTLNIGGPGTITAFPDGSFTFEFEGNSSFFYFSQSQTAFGLPGLQYTQGLLQNHFDNAGNLTSYSHSGAATDECAALS